MKESITTLQERDLISSIRQAGEILRSFWPGDRSNPRGQRLKIEVKPDGSKVTEADFASNDLLVPALRRIFPGDSIVSEEGPRDENHTAHERVWIIDPLDGTRSFIEGADDFSILVALAVKTRVDWSAMYFPMQDLLAVGHRGVKNEINGIPGKVSELDELRRGSVYFRNFTPVDGPYLFRHWMDSGMAFLELCRGRFDGIILRMLSHQEWDIAAPALMVEQCGGRMSDENGDPIVFNQGAIKFKYLVASNGRVHDKILSLIP